MMARARALVLLAAAACVSAQDECPANAATCVGQFCTDPDTTTPNNWYCSCNLQAIGYPKTGAVATCVTPVGECLAGQPGATACPAGQVCVDPNAAVAGDWQCQCMAPATGAAGMQAPAASCTIDECTLPPACAGAGTAQQCSDPSQVMAGDWQCACVGPQVGYPKLAARAGCFTTNTGECAAGQPGSTTCPSTALQVCVDPNAGNANDWTCNCKPPATGTMGTQAAATCTLNECEVLANAAICPSSANQACEDLNTGVLDDWQCKCTAPWTGASVTMAVATCTLDECTVAANAAVCTAAAQTCNDPNTAVAEDWTCTCPGPATGTPVVKAAATCVLDECLTNSLTCLDKGQRCEDPNTNHPGNEGDWTCRCAPPSTSTAVAAAATCTVDECVLDGFICTDAGQLCNDPNTSPGNVGDWTCTCTAPATGTPSVRAAATCTLDECLTNAVTCSDKGQVCEDPNTNHPGNEGDWTCRCAPPSTSTAVAAAATCTVDECVLDGFICTDAGQLCNDPNTSPGNVGDWTCTCTAPATGTPSVGAAATCTLDECLTNAVTCSDKGQVCEDPNTNHPGNEGDWTCRCAPPSTSTAVAAAATCTVDECVLDGFICTDAGQLCNDPNTSPGNVGDWTCTCTAPATGTPSVRAAATCTLDECLTNAVTCTDKGQVCEDPNTNHPGNEGDWTCRCAPPSTSTAVAAAATCTVDECVLDGFICTDAGQLCNDPNTSPGNVGDWTCTCTAPATGTPSVGAAATCTLDECLTNAVTCSDKGQVCEDPNTNHPGNEGDWTCRCAPPSTSTAVAAAATCTVDECVLDGFICTDAGQLCNDPNTSPGNVGDWTCTCTAPATGTPSVRAAATCTLDECLTNAVTCSDKGQVCEDPNTNHPGNEGDWTCRCAPPSTSTAVAAAATCTVDECVLDGFICTDAGQLCNDPNTSPGNVGDWTCTCTAPATGTPSVGAAATCTLDECLTNAVTCSDKGQVCEDPNTNHPGNEGDWTCRCAPPSTSTAVAAAATCTVDECVLDGFICTDAGQLCNDPNTSPGNVGDWTCTCTAPATGTPSVGAAATCTLDECLTNAVTCSDKGQVCEDPNTNHPGNEGDWTCRCAPPSTSTAVAAAATCTVDECVLDGFICTDAGQLCNDPNTSPGNVGDWTCTCPPLTTGSPAVGAPATCAPQDACAGNVMLLCTKNSGCVWKDTTCVPKVTCDTFTCGAGTRDKGQKANTVCGTALSDCTSAQCCDATCEGHTCVRGRLKHPTAVCGALVPDCTDEQCCELLCTSHKCGIGFVGKVMVEPCPDKGCSDETCCDTTCAHADFACKDGTAKQGADAITCGATAGNCTQALCCAAPVQGARDTPAAGLSVKAKRRLTVPSNVAWVASVGTANGGKLLIVKNFNCLVQEVDLGELQPLDWPFHPTGVALGNAVEKYFFGALVFNPLLVIGFALLACTVAYAMKLLMGTSTPRAFGDARAPGVVYLMHTFLLQGTSLVAAQVCFAPAKHSGGVVVLSWFVLLGCVASPAVVYFGVLRRVPVHSEVVGDPAIYGDGESEERIPGRRANAWWYKFLFGTDIWVSRDGYFAEQYGMVYDGLRADGLWYIMAESAAILSLSLLSAYKPSSLTTCDLRNFTISAILVAFFLACLLKRPFIAPVDNLVAILLSALLATAVVAMSVALATEADNDNWLYVVSEWTLFLSTIVVTATALWDFTQYVTDVVESRSAIARELTRQQDAPTHGPYYELFEILDKDAGSGRGFACRANEAVGEARGAPMDASCVRAAPEPLHQTKFLSSSLLRQPTSRCAV